MASAPRSRTKSVSNPSKGSTVTLTVAKPKAKVEVPDVTGLSQGDATEELSGAGFRVRIVEQAVTDAGEDGVVLDQTPAGGAEVKRGATVTITVGKFSAAPNPEGAGGTQGAETPPEQ